MPQWHTSQLAAVPAAMPAATITLTLPVPDGLAPLVALLRSSIGQGELVALSVAVVFILLVRLFWHPSVPQVIVPLEPDEAADVLDGPEPTRPNEEQANLFTQPLNAIGLSPSRKAPADEVLCFDPSTGRLLGVAKAASAADVKAAVDRARAAQRLWASSSFAQRRRLMRILSRCTLDHAEDICRISARDSGKTTTDAAFGEVLVTLEKLAWLCSEGEGCLRPERRSAGRMLFYKTARVEYHPRGVVGAIVPWNYPFHNVLNPVCAALFSGNAIVVKVSEHAAWSSRFYGRLIERCLAAAGAPTDLVQLVTGYGETGAALTAAVEMMTFVGSTRVGKLVMAGAAKTLTPVVLELGGKDPFVLLPGAHVDALAHTAARGGWGSAGQNCIGAERFFVHESLVDAFVSKLDAIAASMRQGPPLNAQGNTGVDIGALCLPGEATRIAALVEDAKRCGARVVSGGTPTVLGKGQFFPPTLVLMPTDAASNEAVRMCRLLQEEVFGPLITVIPFKDEEELISLANGCNFALGSSVFAKSDREAVRVGRRLDAGMLACNDFATCYMCQSLPMGGLKDSGFGKFAGYEGLRGLCVAKAVVEDRFWFMRTQLPPPLRYPLSHVAFPFTRGLMQLFYGHSLLTKLRGILSLARCSLAPSTVRVGASLPHAKKA